MYLTVLYPESVAVKILPEQWDELKNASVLAKQKMQPLQEREVQNIRTMSVMYDEQASAMRAEFSESDIFLYECQNPYKELDKVRIHLSRSLYWWDNNNNESKCTQSFSITVERTTYRD